MKRWIFLLVILVLSAALVIYLFERGLLNGMEWQSTAIIIAAAFGPVKMLFLWFRDLDDKQKNQEQIVAENEQLKADLEKSNKLNKSLLQTEKEAQRLERELELMSANMSLFEKKSI